VIEIKEGEIFLLPPRTPHSPQRGPNTVGLVMEVQRREGMKDRFQWYCENCNNMLHESILNLNDIVKELPVVMDAFYASKELRTCKKCGTVMEPPAKLL
jgi:3-hydroxyanthranilate 3,4-dioxygenase